MKYINRKRFIAFLALTAFACTLYAQTTFPAGDFWSLDAGIGMSNVLVDGHSFQLVIDPKLWLSPPLMDGSRLGVNYSGEADDLMALSTMRANVVAHQLRERGVKEEQIVIIGFGGTRTATSEWDVRNRNRRVELMIIQIGAE